MLHLCQLAFCGRRREEAALLSAGVDAAHVGIHHRNVVAKMETRHGARGVLTDPGQRQELVDVPRNRPLTNLLRALPQAQRAARVAQLSPGAQHICLGRRREVVRGGPAAHPLLPLWGHACDGGLLAHDLA